MRTILLSLSLLSLSVAFSQDSSCDSIFKSGADKFTESKELETDLALIENGGKKLGWQVGFSKGKGILENYVKISLVAVDAKGLGCIDNKAKIIVLFADNSKKEFPNAFSFNCDGFAGIYLYHKGMGTKQNVADLKKLGQVGIKAIRISLSSEYYDFDFTENQTSELLTVLSCLNNKLSD